MIPRSAQALRLVKTGLACPIQSLANDMIVLNPFANRVLCKTDSSMATSMCGIDCSWNLAESVLKISRFTNKGILRRVPSLLAGNPINYSKLGRLSTVEALSGCYYIMGFKDVAQLMLNKFKWGHTFFFLERGRYSSTLKTRTYPPPIDTQHRSHCPELRGCHV